MANVYIVGVGANSIKNQLNREVKSSNRITFKELTEAEEIQDDAKTNARGYNYLFAVFGNDLTASIVDNLNDAFASSSTAEFYYSASNSFGGDHYIPKRSLVTTINQKLGGDSETPSRRTRNSDRESWWSQPGNVAGVAAALTGLTYLGSQIGNPLSEKTMQNWNDYLQGQGEYSPEARNKRIEMARRLAPPTKFKEQAPRTASNKNPFGRSNKKYDW